MGKRTGISWTKSTFNPWIGCTKIGPGCDGCYAAAMNNWLYRGANWGPGAPRREQSEKYWAKPFTWNAAAPDTMFAGRPGFWPVFAASHADIFDNEVDQHLRERFWSTVRATPNLTWQIVTKRIGNAPKMLPADWGNGYPNVWLISTIVDQGEANRDVPKLRDVPARIRGVSYEPALGPVDWTPWLGSLDWIIIGGESRQVGHRPRPFEIAWADSTLDQCRGTGVAVFVKQLGALPGWETRALPLNDKKAGADIAEWPAHLRVREFPRAT